LCTISFPLSLIYLGVSLYTAVNIGYSIGWSPPDTYEDNAALRYFSSFYLSVGAILILGALTYYIDMVVQDHTITYREIESLEDVITFSQKRLDDNLQNTNEKGATTSLQQSTAFAYKYRELLFPCILFITWLIWGLLWSLFR
jgi:hypothetical protein